MNPMRLFLPLLPLILVIVGGGESVWSADAPTAEEWNPVEQALSEDTATAEVKLAALIAAYPRWVDGQRTMAGWRMRHGQADEALASAKQALTLNPSDAAAAAIVVQALGVLHRPGEAFALEDKFVGEKDPKGWVFVCRSFYTFRPYNSAQTRRNRRVGFHHFQRNKRWWCPRGRRIPIRLRWAGDRNGRSWR